MSTTLSSSRTVGGRDVPLPCRVRDASAGSATFLVDAGAARSMLPMPLEPVTPVPGRAALIMTMIDYRDNDLGDYDELSIALVVRRPGALEALRSVTDLLRGQVSTWILHLPVNQEFTCEAGQAIWGVPKSVEDLSIRTADDDQAVCTWRVDGAPVLKLWVPAGGSGSIPDSTLETYTEIGGRLHRTTFATGSEDASIAPGGATLWLGDHPVADQLRRLGLPHRAVTTTWMGRMHGRFEAPVPV